MGGGGRERRKLRIPVRRHKPTQTLHPECHSYRVCAEREGEEGAMILRRIIQHDQSMLTYFEDKAVSVPTQRGVLFIQLVRPLTKAFVSVGPITLVN